MSDGEFRYHGPGSWLHETESGFALVCAPPWNAPTGSPWDWLASSYVVDNAARAGKAPSREAAQNAALGWLDGISNGGG